MNRSSVMGEKFMREMVSQGLAPEICSLSHAMLERAAYNDCKENLP